MIWIYLVAIAVVLGMLWRSRRRSARILLSPSGLGEVLGRSRDAVHRPQTLDVSPRDQPPDDQHPAE